MADPYVYAGTNTLVNHLGIHDTAKLAEVDATYSVLAMARLQVQRIPGSYDLKHLQAFHREIFARVYPWAGEIRAVPISKTQLFAMPQHIEPYVSNVFEELKQENRLKGLAQEKFVERLTHYYAEINAVHPFRDGNGRTQRAFLTQLAHDAGYEIEWERPEFSVNDEASRASLNGDNSRLHEMFTKLVQKSEDSRSQRVKESAAILVESYRRILDGMPKQHAADRQNERTPETRHINEPARSETDIGKSLS